jgi:prophage regulatory protein
MTGQSSSKSRPRPRRREPPRPRVLPTKAAKPTRFLRLPQVIDRVGMSRSSIYRLMAREAFPRPFKPSEVASRWLESDIDDFIDVILAGRRWSMP